MPLTWQTSDILPGDFFVCLAKHVKFYITFLSFETGILYEFDLNKLVVNKRLTEEDFSLSVPA